jgi:hypothetical protein
MAELLTALLPTFSEPPALDITVRLDRSAPGAHLIWDIGNASRAPIALRTLVVHGRKGDTQTMPFHLPHVLAPGEHLLMPTDVDWTLLGARTIAVVDERGREHAVARRQLSRVQQQLRSHIDRREPASTSARDWLFGATDLAFGAVLLGLGFFLLMYMIATG